MLQRPKRLRSSPAALGGYGGLVAETSDRAQRMSREQADTPGLPFGELFREPHHLRGDLRLLRRAMREGWPIPEESRRVLLDRVSRIIQEPESVSEGIRDRAVLGAAWVLLEADRENLRGLCEALGSPLGELRVHRRTTFRFRVV